MPDLEDGESAEVQGSAATPYVIKNTGGVFSCTCPAWRNQSHPIERRTCKHIRKLRGEDAEKERLGGELPARAASSTKAGSGPPLLLAHAWDNACDLTDWWMSEKLDGVRAYWDGKQFLSRQGNVFHAPDWFVAGLPATPLDGELWMDRKKFQKTVSVVRRQDKGDQWRDIRYLVFDAPSRGETFEERMDFLRDAFDGATADFAEVHNHELCRSEPHLLEELARVESLGGEGLMLRQPSSKYEVGRSSTLLKVKTFHDAEAVVIDHQAGRGKHKGKLGSLLVKLSDGTEFSVGTGFSDAQRAAPPTVGSSITFRYQELSDGGVPRFPSFVGVREMADSPVLPAAKPQSTPANRISVPTESAENSSDEQPAETAADLTRYFEFSDAKSHKFWEISRRGNDVTVRYGRIGTNGQTRTKSFTDEAKATAHLEKLVGEKTGKGYEEA
ncbi:MAG: DNA ligase [Pirellulaceae bacterium]|jgi:DNA ligase-1|nr:DNA ligase [Pirellulaceae bacterium]MDP7015839.1 DNA ligase [Pirellulaceae bacterium]